jgi:hypothetical protein
MCEKMKSNNVFRWLGRILTIVFLLQTLIPLVMGGGFQYSSICKTSYIIIGFGIYYIALIIGFKWEALGGIASILSLLAIFFYMVFFKGIRGEIPFLAVIILFGMIPGIFYLVSWNIIRQSNEKT